MPNLVYALLVVLLPLNCYVARSFLIRTDALSFRQRRKATAILPTSLCSSSSNDLWDADSPLKQEWASSLPLPENAKDESMADRARNAMAGPSPPSLKGRCHVNLEGFDGRVKWLHVDPPVFIVDDFLSDKECWDTLQLTNQSPPAGVGRVIKLESRLSQSNKSRGVATRTSTTWYVRYAADALAPLLAGLLELLPNIALEQLEEVQLVRYEGEGQEFGWHKDDLGMKEATPDVGGQRIATLLVYLDECCDNGRTVFRDLRGENNQRLAVSPKRGRALLFFPAVTGTTMLDGDNTAALIADDDSRETFGDVYFDNTRADHRTTHAGEPPTGNGGKGQKNIAQLWIHSSGHTPVVFGRGLNRHAEARRRL